MKWISYFFTFKIPFYIYKLKTSDAIIETPDNQQEQSIIILHGVIYFIQIFSNKEVLPIAILKANNIIDINNYSIKTKSYYKIIALKETYILRFSHKHIKNNNYITKEFLKYYLINYKLTIYHQEIMNYILVQKNTQYRIVQLIILLSIQFGTISQDFIKIPLKIRKRDIALMTGSNINTIHKTLKILEIKKLLKYSKKNFILVPNSFFIHFMYLLK